MSELHPISAICTDPARKDQRKADVVFVHGLGGDHVLTWQHGDRNEDFWPAWVAEEFPDVGVWTLSYAASPSAWFRLLKKLPLRWMPGLNGFYEHADRDTGHSMHLPDRGVEVLNGLALDGLGSRPLIFVCHSLGGLLAKQVLRTAGDDSRADWKAVRDNTAAVMFLSTPHAGSHLATVINRIGKGLRVSPSLYGLQANDPHLRNLGQWYVGNMAHAEHVVYYEIRDTFGVRVVDEASAQLGLGGTAVPQDEDHLSIAKPRKPDERVCKDLRRILSKVVADAATKNGVLAHRVSTEPQVTAARIPPVEVHVHIPSSPSQPANGPITPCQLPRAASRFFGREQEVQTLVTRLGRERMTVVAGAAGLGKTALAAEALRRTLGERPWGRLADTPFPHGIVYVDLYAQKDQPGMAWRQIAESVGGNDFLLDKTDDIRAREACRGRHLLLIVEGGEEADGGPRADGAQRPNWRSLLDPLQWEGSLLWLTRPTPTSPPAHIVLGQPLEEDEADHLLEYLTTDAPRPPDAETRAALATLLARHPLALTWAGGLLQQGGVTPQRLVEELRQQPARALHDPENTRHTLQWLFLRSMRLLDSSASGTLTAAGLLAHAPFPLSAMCAATGLAPDAQAAALRQCVQSRLLDLDVLPDHWRFDHALGHHFAQSLAVDLEEDQRGELLQRLMDWADRQLQAELAANLPMQALVHAEALLQAELPPQGWQPLAQNLLYIHYDRLEALGRLGECSTLLRLIEAWLLRMPAAEQDGAEWQREGGVIQNRLGDVLQAQGNLAGAKQRYEAGLRISDALATRDPDDAGWQRDLSVSENKLGEVLWEQGDLAGAQRRYEASLRIIDALARRDPENADWQRDLSVSQNKLGDLLQAQGDLAGAQQCYEVDLRIAEALAKRDPENAGWQRDLSVSQNKLGDLLQAQGDLAGAQQRYEASLLIRDALARRDPENAGWQRDLSVSFERLGDLLQAQGDLAGAQQRYEADLRIAEALATRDPDNAGWQRDLARSWINLGTVSKQRGDAQAAQTHWQQAQTILQRLVQRAPDHPGFRQDLAWLQQQIAQLGL